MFDEYKMSVRFELEDDDGKLTRDLTLDDDVSWTKLVIKFTDFLSAQYGYSISEKVLFITDFPIGFEQDYAISKDEYELIQANRNRDMEELESVFADEYGGCEHCIHATCATGCNKRQTEMEF